MDTIRNYLNNMFLGLPQNENTKKAKEELLSMMEDKYHELKNEGKTENEAIGIVISEFGNLDEVSDLLGIKVETVNQSEKSRVLSTNEVREYLQETKKQSPKIALGVAIMISASSVLLFLLGLYELELLSIDKKNVPILGIIVMFLLAAISINLIVRSTMKLEKYKYLKNEEWLLDPLAKQEVNLIKEAETEKFGKILSIAVVMYILSVVPLFVTIFIFGRKNEGPILISLSLFMIIVATATYTILSSYGIRNAVNRLVKKEKNCGINDTNNKPEKFASIYWSVVAAIYLGYSFITYDWARSWIIWPIAGILYNVVNMIFNKE